MIIWIGLVYILGERWRLENNPDGILQGCDKMRAVQMVGEDGWGRRMVINDNESNNMIDIELFIINTKLSFYDSWRDRLLVASFPH